MKKLTLVAVIATVAAFMFSCGNSPKANMKDEVDSLSYAIGLAQTHGFKDYLESMGVDSAYMDEFYRGLNAGVSAGDDKKKSAYYMGVQIGQQITNQIVRNINYRLFGDDSTQTISVRNFMAGFISGVQDKNTQMSMMEAETYAQAKMESVREKNLEKQYADNKEAGERFLAKYAKEKGVKALGGGVLYKVINEGNGPIPADSMTVEVDYEGKDIEGNVFDSSYEKGKPFETRVKGPVIKGWTEVLTHMPVGSTWEVAIPQEQAYGSGSPRGIKPFSALVFKIELKSIKK